MGAPGPFDRPNDRFGGRRDERHGERHGDLNVGPAEQPVRGTRHPFPPSPPPAGRGASYWAWLVCGLFSPFALAALLYPLAWWPVWAALLPAAAVLWSLLSAVLAALGATPADAPELPPPTGPMPWDLGPSLSPGVALCWALAFLAALLVISHAAGPRGLRRGPEPTSSRRGFAAGLRAAFLIVFLLVIWWARSLVAA